MVNYFKKVNEVNALVRKGHVDMAKMEGANSKILVEKEEIITKGGAAINEAIQKVHDACELYKTGSQCTEAKTLACSVIKAVQDDATAKNTAITAFNNNVDYKLLVAFEEIAPIGQIKDSLIDASDNAFLNCTTTS